MNILYQDDYIFAVDKPAGHFVHPPEFSPYPVPKEKICLYQLRKLMKQDVYPAHRLDAPTTGVLLWARSREGARELGRLFMDREVQKTYYAVVRGYLDAEGTIDMPLEVDEDGTTAESVTTYKTLAQVELPFAVGKKYPTSRYSLMEVRPVTGRWHQIRRHFDRIAHPLLGDIEHGDSHHNRFFRDELHIKGLCLRAARLQFTHPWNGESLDIRAPQDEKWAKIQDLFNFK